MNRGEEPTPVLGTPSSTDVARLAGVSRKTVSRVFNEEQYVSADAHRRVVDAAERLGYRPNQAARALASGRARAIGVVTRGSAGYGPAALLVAIERAVRDAGYAFRQASTIKGDPAGLAGAVRVLLEQGVDGLLVAEPIDERPEPIRVDVPVLFLGAPPTLTAPHMLTIGVGGYELARAATEHLLNLGHPSVHHLAGPQQWYVARDRLAGWRDALAARGIPEPATVEGAWSASSGYLAGRRLARDHDVTAVFAAGDEMAIGLIRALADAGRPVPDDVSVVGIDDNPVSAYVTPPLTTMRPPFDAAAHEGVELLVQTIDRPGAELPSPSAPPVELIVRSSTAPYAARHVTRRRPRQVGPAKAATA
jgi:DNA-binding LacI/PurR family transcriptional regulator